MPTVIEILQTAVEMNGVYSPGEPISGSDTERMLEQLNTMLDVWSTESLSCYAVKEQAMPLVVGRQQYTIGSGGDVDATRPIRLIEGPGAAYVMDSNNQRYGIDVVTRDRWNYIGSPRTTSNVVNVIFYDPQFPLGILNVYPVPNVGGYTLYFDAFQQLGNFDDTGASVSFPPGYRAAIQSNLAVFSAPFFKSASVSPDVLRLARYSKKALKRANRRTAIAIYDDYIVSRPYATYDIYSDSMSREV